MSKKVFCVEWEEYEKGWGPRFDGYSYHVSEDERRKYTEEYVGDPKEIHTAMPLSRWEEVNDFAFMRAEQNGGSIHVRSRIVGGSLKERK